MMGEPGDGFRLVDVELWLAVEWLEPKEER